MVKIFLFTVVDFVLKNGVKIQHICINVYSTLHCIANKTQSENLSKHQKLHRAVSIFYVRGSLCWNAEWIFERNKFWCINSKFHVNACCVERCNFPIQPWYLARKKVHAHMKVHQFYAWKYVLQFPLKFKFWWNIFQKSTNQSLMITARAFNDCWILSFLT